MSSHNPFANAYPVGGPQWTAEEDQRLLEMKSSNRSYREISAALGRRTIAACKCRVNQILNRTEHKKLWTDQETELAKKLISENASDEICKAVLGRTRQACADRLRRAQDSFGSARKSGFSAVDPHVPPHVLEDRNRRLMAQKSLTAQLCGDPEPGRAKL